MVLGLSKFKGKGWDKDLFYQTFKPEVLNEYKPKDFVRKFLNGGFS
jgi:hypothetical protein